jgi:murein DD-endopeptidase MepM/ murein hydrolase activator NlpD
MRFPVGNTGTKEEFERDWYNAQGFGVQTSYGWHEGCDINLKTGGDTDLNKELKAISSGRLVYYHYSSHPTTGFGRHLVYKINGPWGSRWVMYSHMSDLDFLKGEQDISEGQILGRLGKSGNSPSAHLHWSIYKVDPVGFGIDNYANTQTELNDLWEDPIAFVNKWMVAPAPIPVPDIRLSLLDQAGILTEGDTRLAVDRNRNYPNLEAEKNNLQNQYNSYKERVKSAIDAVN